MFWRRPAIGEALARIPPLSCSSTVRLRRYVFQLLLCCLIPVLSFLLHHLPPDLLPVFTLSFSRLFFTLFCPRTLKTTVLPSLGVFNAGFAINRSVETSPSIWSTAEIKSCQLEQEVRQSSFDSPVPFQSKEKQLYHY